MLKKPLESLTIFSRDWGRRAQIKLLEDEKNTMSEMKNTLDWINSRFDYTEEKISKFEDMAIESFQKKLYI